MSKRRLAITAVLAGATQSEAARTYNVSQGWISRLMARYRVEGEAAFEPLSRRPHTSPNATAPETVELVLRLRKELTEQGHDAGADTIGWHLLHHHQTQLPRATIHRILVRNSAVVPDPSKRPKASYIRFEAEQPNETWQSDFTHYRLTGPDGTVGVDVEILTWLDDHSRYALHISAHVRVTGPIVLAAFRETAAQHGYPASVLTDNGMVYTTRFSGGRGGRNHLEFELRELNIVQKNSRPNHPTTCGKVERFQQTLKKWLRAQPVQPTTIAELQALLDRFAVEYNTTAAAPLPAPQRHPRHGLRRPPQSRPLHRPDRRHPRPGPHRQGQQERHRHPARGRPTPPHRHRPNPRRNRHPPARPRPRRPHRQRRHRRDPPRTRSSTHPATTKAPAGHPARHRKDNEPEPTSVGSGYADVLRHHTGAACRNRTDDLFITSESLYRLS